MPKTSSRLAEAAFSRHDAPSARTNLRAIAKRGYEGALTTDLDQQAQAIGLFLSDTLLQI
jgi:hypothetical protein